MFVILQISMLEGNTFTLQADEAFYIGSSPATESYLVMEKILNVAKLSGAQVLLFCHASLIGSLLNFLLFNLSMSMFLGTCIFETVFCQDIMILTVNLRKSNE